MQNEMIDFDNMESAADYWKPISGWFPSIEAAVKSLMGYEVIKLLLRDGNRYSKLIEICNLSGQKSYRICRGVDA